MGDRREKKITYHWLLMIQLNEFSCNLCVEFHNKHVRASVENATLSVCFVLIRAVEWQ